MPDAMGNPLQRDIEAKLPKVICNIVAPARADTKHVPAGGYADRDGMHVTGHIFLADGRERQFRFTGPMIRRLQGNPMLDVRLDKEALEIIAGDAPGVSLSSELDEKNRRIKELEDELETRTKNFDGLIQRPEPRGDDEAMNLDAGAQLGAQHQVVRVETEDPEVRPERSSKKEGKSGK